MKKAAAKFKIKSRGYNRQEVEDFIEKEQQKADEVQMRQRERITELSLECKRLEDELAAYKGREEQIKSAFITAAANADKLTKDVKARYAEELQRLRLFRAKWLGAYEQLKERYHFDKDALNMESVAVSVEMELTKFLQQDFSLNKGGEKNEMEEYFRSEVDRLTRQQQSIEAESAPKSKAVDELRSRLKDAELRKAKPQENAAFSLEDALNPTESLEEICRSLGIN